MIKTFRLLSYNPSAAHFAQAADINNCHLMVNMFSVFGGHHHLINLLLGVINAIFTNS